MALPDPITIVPADLRRAVEFREIAGRLREVLGPVALRIDHVGSTAVPGLDAKPVIDIQVSVRSLDPMDPYRRPLELLGYTFRPGNPDRTRRSFRRPTGQRRTDLDARAEGSFDEQLNLLFRDFLRTHSDAAREYAEAKWGLSATCRNDLEGYVQAKAPTVWSLLRRAHAWSQATGWAPGPSDA